MNYFAEKMYTGIGTVDYGYSAPGYSADLGYSAAFLAPKNCLYVMNHYGYSADYGYSAASTADGPPALYP